MLRFCSQVHKVLIFLDFDYYFLVLCLYSAKPTSVKPAQYFGSG